MLDAVHVVAAEEKVPIVSRTSVRGLREAVSRQTRATRPPRCQERSAPLEDSHRDRAVHRLAARASRAQGRPRLARRPRRQANLGRAEGQEAAALVPDEEARPHRAPDDVQSGNRRRAHHEEPVHGDQTPAQRRRRRRVDQGEQWNLELSDVRVDDPSPHIVVRFGSKGRSTKDKKTHRVPLMPAAVAVEERWLKLLPAYASENREFLVFPTPRGCRR